MTHQKQNDFEDRVMNNALSKMMDEFDDHYPICQDTHCVFFSKPMMDILREVIREAQIPEERISQLRQWVNEKPKDRLVTNEDIKMWLYGENFDK